MQENHIVAKIHCCTVTGVRHDVQLHSNNYTDKNNTVSQKQKFASSTHVQHHDITLHISHDYSLLIQNKRVNSPLRSQEVEIFSRKGGAALPAALVDHPSDGGRRVSQRACCYHAMIAGHDELRNDGHQMAVSCYRDRNLKNDLPPGDVDAWRRLTPSLNACAVTCLEGDVLVALPDPVE